MYQSEDIESKVGSNAGPVQFAEIIVAIPTFRRLGLLQRLLDSLTPELAGQNLLVLIGDNDCDQAVRDIIEARTEPAGLRYVPIATRGVSQVRNGLITEAGRIAPQWRWLVMLDDDGYVTPGWFAALIKSAHQLDVDLLGGPVEGELPPNASELARNSVYARRNRYPTGVVTMLNGMQNVAIRRSLLPLLGEKLFDPRLGGSGGEDHELFKRALDKGASLGWCDEAVVIEPTPASQITTRALLYRYFSTGTYMAMLDRERHGLFKETFSASKGLLRGSIEAMLGTVFLNSQQRAKGILASAHYFGRLASLTGVRSERYGSEPQHVL